MLKISKSKPSGQVCSSNEYQLAILSYQLNVKSSCMKKLVDVLKRQCAFSKSNCLLELHTLGK